MMRKVISMIGASIFVAILSLCIPTEANAEYFGSRWEAKTICVLNNVDNYNARLAVRDAVHDMRKHTDLYVVNSGSSCENYNQVIRVVDWNYSAGWVGYTEFNGWTWGKTDKGWWTWFNNSNMRILLNTKYHNTRGGWQHVAIHELSHAVGLDHVKDTCHSVVTQKPGCEWETHLQWGDRWNINDIYGR